MQERVIQAADQRDIDGHGEPGTGEGREGGQVRFGGLRHDVGRTRVAP
jgi:hypothetical protein